VNVEATTQEAATTAVSVDDKREADSDSELIAVIVRQQELIVRQSEQLLRAMEATLNGTGKPASLRAEVDELLAALANITADDITRYAAMAKSLFETLTRSGVVGGGAVRSRS
jgi:hypothetical protein